MAVKPTEFTFTCDNTDGRACQRASSPDLSPDAGLMLEVERDKGGVPDVIDLVVLDEKPLGEGGQSRVWRVRWAERPNAGLVVKMFSSEAAARREWAVLSAHSDDKTVPLGYALGRLCSSGPEDSQNAGRPAEEGPRQWAVLMEYVEGPLLSDVLAGYAKGGRRLTVTEAIEAVAPVLRFCSGSRTGFVHCDIKPENIVLEEGGATRLLDFGVAARGDSDRLARGTFGYADPQQWQGPRHAQDQGLRAEGRPVPETDVSDECQAVSAALADPRIDTYGVAAVLWAALTTGEPPAYGHVPCETPDLVHDDAMLDQIRRRLSANLWETFGLKLGENDLDAYLLAAVARVDALVLDRVRRGLAQTRADRPSPHEFEGMLPLTAERYADRVFDEGRLIALHPAALGGADAGEPADDAEASRDFIEALDLFNCGYYERAVQIFRYQARRGNNSAKYYLAVCMRRGLGVEGASSAEVAALLGDAAEGGNILAQNMLGQMLYDGREIPQNRERGIDWIRQSAADDPDTGKRGFLEAQLWLRAHDRA